MAPRLALFNRRSSLFPPVCVAVSDDPQNIFHIIVLIPGIFLRNIVLMNRLVSDHADLVQFPLSDPVQIPILVEPPSKLLECHDSLTLSPVHPVSFALSSSIRTALGVRHRLGRIVELDPIKFRHQLQKQFQILAALYHSRIILPTPQPLLFLLEFPLYGSKMGSHVPLPQEIPEYKEQDHSNGKARAHWSPLLSIHSSDSPFLLSQPSPATLLQKISFLRFPGGPQKFLRTCLFYWSTTFTTIARFSSPRCSFAPFT